MRASQAHNEDACTLTFSSSKTGRSVKFFLQCVKCTLSLHKGVLAGISRYSEFFSIVPVVHEDNAIATANVPVLQMQYEICIPTHIDGNLGITACSGTLMGRPYVKV